MIAQPQKEPYLLELSRKTNYYWKILLFFDMIHVKSFVKEKEYA